MSRNIYSGAQNNRASAMLEKFKIENLKF